MDRIKDLAIVVLTVTSFIFIFRAGNLNRELDSIKSKLTETAAKAEADLIRVESESAKVSEDTATGWIAAVDYWQSRVQHSTVCTSTVPKVPTTAAGTGELPERESSPSSFPDAAAAIKDAAYIEHLKHWIHKQERIYNEKDQNQTN